MVTDLFSGLSCLTLVFGAPANQVQLITNIKDAAMLLIFKNVWCKLGTLNHINNIKDAAAHFQQCGLMCVLGTWERDLQTRVSKRD